MKAFVDAMVEERKRDFEKKLTTDEGKKVLRDETERQRVLRSAREDKLKAMSKSARKEARIKEKFHHFDMDQSGFLDEEEFGLMLDSFWDHFGIPGPGSIFGNLVFSVHFRRSGAPFCKPGAAK